MTRTPDLYRAVLFVLVVLTLSRIHQHYDWLAALQPAMVLGGVAAGYAFLRPDRLNFQGLRRYWPPQLMLALALLAGVSALFGLSTGRSGAYILQVYSKVLILAFMVIAALRNARDLSLFVWAFVLAAGILCGLAIFVFDLEAAGEGVRRLADLYTFDANGIGVVLAMALPLVLLVFQTSGWPGKAVSVLVLLAIGVTAARSGSRGMFVGLGAVVLALVVWVSHVALAKRLGLVLILAAGLVVASPQGYWDQMATLTNLEEDYNVTSYYGRLNVAQRGVDYMLENPLTGVGINNFPMAEGTISDRARGFVPGPGRGLKWRAAHNSYIQAGSEMGVPGLLLWTALVVGGIVGMRRLKKRLPDRWRVGDDEERFLYLAALYLPVSFVGFAVTSSFVSFAYLDPVYLLAAMATGLYAAVDRKTSRAQAADAAPPAGAEPVREEWEPVAPAGGGGR